MLLEMAVHGGRAGIGRAVHGRVVGHRVGSVVDVDQRLSQLLGRGADDARDACMPCSVRGGSLLNTLKNAVERGASVLTSLKNVVERAASVLTTLKNVAKTLRAAS